MKASLFYPLLIFSLVSCSSEPIPKDVLPPEKMKLIMWDLSRADELAAYYGTKDSAWLSPSMYHKEYAKVFRIHKVRKDEFDRSLAWYENNPPQLKVLIDSLQKFGERKQKEYDALKSKPPADDTSKRKNVPKLDSLKRNRNILRGL